MEQSGVELHHLEFHHHDLMFSYFCYCFLLDLSKHYQTHQPVSQLSFCKYSPLAPKIDHLLTWQYKLFVRTELAAEKVPRIARFYFWGKHNCTRFCPFQSSTVQTDNPKKKATASWYFFTLTIPASCSKPVYFLKNLCWECYFDFLCFYCPDAELLEMAVPVMRLNSWRNLFNFHPPPRFSSS